LEALSFNHETNNTQTDSFFDFYNGNCWLLLLIFYRTYFLLNKNSDHVLVENKNGEHMVALYCDGFMDGSNFGDWYDHNGYEIGVPIVRWMKIPE